MRELNFVRDQKVHEAWRHVQWNFMEDIEAAVEDQIRHYLNGILRIEADRQLGADPYERTLERLDYRAGYRKRTLITPKGTHELQVPKARRTPGSVPIAAIRAPSRSNGARSPWMPFAHKKTSSLDEAAGICTLRLTAATYRDPLIPPPKGDRCVHGHRRRTIVGPNFVLF